MSEPDDVWKIFSLKKKKHCLTATLSPTPYYLQLRLLYLHRNFIYCPPRVFRFTRRKTLRTRKTDDKGCRGGSKEKVFTVRAQNVFCRGAFDIFIVVHVERWKLKIMTMKEQKFPSKKGTKEIKSLNPSGLIKCGRKGCELWSWSRCFIDNTNGAWLKETIVWFGAKLNRMLSSEL